MTERTSTRDAGTGRSLKTAAEALAALRFLGAAAGGVTAESLGVELGKSAATARYLLNTLCQEGYAHREGHTGNYRLSDAPPWGDAWGGLWNGASATRTPRRSPRPTSWTSRRPATPCARCAARTTRSAATSSPRASPTPSPSSTGAPGSGPTSPAGTATRRSSSTPAATRAWRASPTCASASRWPRPTRWPSRRPSSRPPRRSSSCCSPSTDRTAFTATTITTTPGLARELAQVRRDGVAIDREEFAEGFCCVGAPDPRPRRPGRREHRRLQPRPPLRAGLGRPHHRRPRGRRHRHARVARAGRGDRHRGRGAPRTTWPPETPHRAEPVHRGGGERQARAARPAARTSRDAPAPTRSHRHPSGLHQLDSIEEER